MKKLTVRKQAIKDLRSKGVTRINNRILKKSKNIEINSKYLEVFGVVLGLKDPRERKKVSKKDEYNNYLKSNQWRIFRELILFERGNYCENCNEWFESLDMHHIHYNNFKKELRQDVLVLCKDCHTELHQTIKNPPYTLERLHHVKKTE